MACITNGCESHKIISNREIDNIVIIRDPFAEIEGRQGTIKEIIKNKDSIKHISDFLNSAQPYPVKFLAKYKLEINYKDTSILVLANSGNINIAGRTYHVDIDILSIIGDVGSSNVSH